MQVADVLALPACAEARVVGRSGSDLTRTALTRTVRLAHVIDVPDAHSWVRPGTLLLTTGLSWPRESAALTLFGQDVARRGPAAVVLAVPHFFPAFPPEVAEALAASGIPALELPWEVPFVEVVQQTHEFILHAQADHLARSESIHRALTRAALGGQLSDVAGTLSEQLGRAALLLAPNGYPLTRSSLLTRTPLTHNSDDSGESEPAQITPHPALQSAPDPALARLALARPGTAPRPLAGGMLVPVVLRGQREGGVWVAGAAPSEQAGPGYDLEVRAAEHAATVAALLMLAQQDMEVLEARLGYAFVDTLLEGRFTADSSLHERARRLGFDVVGHYTVALLVLPGALPLLPEGFAQREQAASQLRGALVSLGAAPLVSVSLNHIWFLLPHTLSAERVWARLGWQDGGNANAVPGNAGLGLIPGMVYGRARVGVAGVAQGRAEVLALAAYAHPGQLRSYAQVLVPRALSGDRDAQADLMRGLLEPLRGARGGAALIATVQALCDTGFAQAEAAARLGIHGNTLRYRMDRVEALTGRPLADPATRSLWWLALQLGALEENQL